MSKIGIEARIKYWIIVVSSVILVGVVFLAWYTNHMTSTKIQNPVEMTAQPVGTSTERTITYTTPSGEIYTIQSKVDTQEVQQSIADGRDIGKPQFATEAPTSSVDKALENSATAIFIVAQTLQIDFSQTLLDAEKSISVGNFTQAQEFIDVGLTQINQMNQDITRAETYLQDLDDMANSQSLTPSLKQSIQTYIKTTTTFAETLKSLFEIRRITLTLEPSSQAEANEVQALTTSVNQQAQFFAESLRNVRDMMDTESVSQ